jgi:crotonobetainyl-CoA:carnitine CoA-transferase CaiB-like acyl-CoA transferase
MNRAITDPPVGPLDGLRIVDLTRVLAGPFCTQILADLGAEVIKVERVGKGDDSRYSGPKLAGESTHFMTVNRNKRSVTLDLKSDAGREVLLDLIERSDALVENFRPGVRDRLGLDYATLSARNPRIIVCSISGFGMTGPLRDRPSFDAIAQAMTGAMSVTGEDGMPPVRLGAPMGDLGGGVYGAIAILAALHAGRISGRGAEIDISLYDCMMGLMHYYFTDFTVTGEEPPRAGSGNPNIFPYGAFETSDGHIVIAAFQTRFWHRLCGALGLTALIDDERFCTNDERVANRVELRALLESVLCTQPRAHWQEVLDEVDVPNAPIKSVGEVATAPHTAVRNMVETFEHPAAGTVAVTGRPIKYVDRPLPGLRPSPLLGEHSEEVLRDVLGYDSDQIDALVDAGVTSKVAVGSELEA